MKNFRITDYEWDILEEIYKYLRRFKILTKVCNGEKYSTLNALVLAFNMLLDELEASITVALSTVGLN